MAAETKFDLSNRLYYLLLVAIAGGLIYIAGSLGLWLTNDASQKEISVSGEGKVYVKPDVAIVTLGVTTEGQKSDQVVKENSEKMNRIIKAVKDQGIDEKDIQTSMYNLYPKYNYTKDRGSYLDGYTLSQQITVKIRNFDKISGVLDKATANGANSVGSLQITLDNQDKVKADARQKAIEAAKQKAAEMAKQSGLRLGKVTNISESYGGASEVYPMYAKSMDSSSGVGGAAPQIETGQKEVTAYVTITYKIK